MIQMIDESLPHNVIAHSNEADAPDIWDCIDTFPTNVAAVSTHYLLEHLIAYGDTFDVGGELSTRSLGLMSLSLDLEYALSSSMVVLSSKVNALLDSGCSHHLIKDISLFSSYDVSRATSVTTANCGSLHALAMGNVTHGYSL